MTAEKLLEVFMDRKRAYTLVFGESPASLAVLDDLTVFCRGRETCLIPGDHDRTYALLGRNEVFHRIRDHLELSPEQLLAKYTRPAIGANGHDDQSDPPQ
jgi:hypothetical protein